MTTASCYGPHYRWIKLDTFNPGQAHVHVRVSGVPLLVPPGRSVLAVKTADAVERHYQCLFGSIPIEVTGPAAPVVLYLDNVRMEQELPSMLSRTGRMIQFPARADAKDPPVIAPGYSGVEVDMLYSAERGLGWTAPKTLRAPHGHSFRSNEHGLLWGCTVSPDAPFRVDVPKGRYGVFVFGAPGYGYQWAQGLNLKINGREHKLLAPRNDAEVRKTALSGETWDFRPGACVWEALVRQPYYPSFEMAYEEAMEGRLLIEFPKTLALHGLIVFPESEKETALKELSRLNYLLAESWDVAHPWVKGTYARKSADGHPYIGCHDEMIRPETIPDRLAALRLTDADFARGFLVFQRGLTEAVYSDTIPTPDEAAVRELRAVAVPGQRVCVTLGLLPLAPTANLRFAVADLVQGKQRIAADRIDVRISRQHQKTMQFGHHNHDYNYEEHYLVHRPQLDLHLGAARRAYLDIAVPAEARPGEYVGAVTIQSAQGKELARLPLVVELFPVALEEPPVFFASSNADPRLLDYGMNACAGSYDHAVKHGYKAYLANLGHGPVSFKGKPLGWSSFLANKEQLQSLIDDGRTGKGPRGFFGGPAPNTHSNPKAEAVAKEFFDSVQKEFPRIDLLGLTLPAFFHGRYQGLQTPHEWIVLASPAKVHSAEALEAACQSGKEFWFIDGMRHSKEQVARFTFGLWLWRLGAKGRFTSMEAHLQYGGGTARPTYSHEPYFTLLDVTTCNVDRAIKESLTEGQWNPCRDLILLRAGIDDYRTMYTLDRHIERAEAKKTGETALAAARKFRDDLRRELTLDLTKYYDARAGAYGENWYPLPDNPWKEAKFDRVRRIALGHIQTLRQSAGK